MTEDKSETKAVTGGTLSPSATFSELFATSPLWEGRNCVGRDGDGISNVGRDVPPVTGFKAVTGKLWEKVQISEILEQV